MKFNSLAVLALAAPTASAFSPSFFKKHLVQQHGAAFPIFHRQNSNPLKMAEDSQELSGKEQNLERISEATAAAEVRREAIEKELAIMRQEDLAAKRAEEEAKRADFLQRAKEVKMKVVKRAEEETKITAKKAASKAKKILSTAGSIVASAVLFALVTSNVPAPVAAEEILMQADSNPSEIIALKEVVAEQTPPPAPKKVLKPLEYDLDVDISPKEFSTTISTTSVTFIVDEPYPAPKVEIKKPEPAPKVEEKKTRACYSTKG